MRQVLFHLPVVDWPVPGYGFMLFLAYLTATHLAAWRARREGLDPETIYDLALWLFVGGLVGARALYVWQYWGTRIRTVGEAFAIWNGGIVFYGSMIGGAIAFFAYRAFRPFPLRPVMDVIAPSLAVGIALGRFGCFLNGCCYGDLCTVPGLGLRFPAHSSPWVAQREAGLIGDDAPESLPVHATQLYSVVDGLLLLALLTAMYPLRRRDGEVFGLLLLTYPVSRFLIEYLRNDEGVFLAGMTISQAISAVLFVVGIVYAWRLRRLPESVATRSPEPEAVAT